MGRISLDVLDLGDGKIQITRSCSGFIMSEATTLDLDLSYDKAVAQLTDWSNGAVAQVALSDWGVEIREWLIGGFLPGHDMNPYHH
jgi:hypothetical protein